MKFILWLRYGGFGVKGCNLGVKGWWFKGNVWGSYRGLAVKIRFDVYVLCYYKDILNFFVI